MIKFKIKLNATIRACLPDITLWSVVDCQKLNTDWIDIFTSGYSDEFLSLPIKYISFLFFVNF